MKITVTPGGSYAPGAYIVTAEDGRDILIQSDWDFPGLARSFGWAPTVEEDGCPHDGTDGTIRCPGCGMTVGEFLTAAIEFLDGEPEAVEDPGYFEEAVS